MVITDHRHLLLSSYKVFSPDYAGSSRPISQCPPNCSFSEIKHTSFKSIWSENKFSDLCLSKFIVAIIGCEKTINFPCFCNLPKDHVFVVRMWTHLFHLGNWARCKFKLCKQIQTQNFKVFGDTLPCRVAGQNFIEWILSVTNSSNSFLETVQCKLIPNSI